MIDITKILELGENYKKFKKFLEEEEFDKSFVEIFGKKWINNNSISKKIYTTIFYLYARITYLYCGGSKNLKINHNTFEYILSIIYESSDLSRTKSMVSQAGYILKRKKIINCCDDLCEECMGSLYNIYPSYEDSDDILYGIIQDEIDSNCGEKNGDDYDVDTDDDIDDNTDDEYSDDHDVDTDDDTDNEYDSDYDSKYGDEYSDNYDDKEKEEENEDDIKYYIKKENYDSSKCNDYFTYTEILFKIMESLNKSM